MNKPPKKLIIPLLFFAALAQIVYRARWNQFTDVLAKPLLHFADYSVFGDEIQALALFFGLALLFVAIFFLSSPSQTSQKNINKFWFFGFLGILLVASANVVYINPQGRFPWNKRDNYIELETRSRKPDLYKKLARTPDLILFGSSVSFLVPMDYFKETWGLQAFNMSVNGGAPADFVNLLHTIQKSSPDSKMPSVMMIEILNPGLSVNNLEQTPLDQIPDMASINQQANTSWITAKSTLKISSVADALFTTLFVDQGRWDVIATLKDDGTMIENQGDLTDKQYQKSVEKNIVLLDELQSCDSLDEDGKSAFENLVQMSREYKFSLVVYRTPINRDFYKLVQTTPTEYANCAQLFDQFVKSLSAQNPNLFFTDLSQYQPIAAGGKEFYRDTHHLTAQGNLLLLETLSPEIESALRWVQQNR